jgi:4-hydroxy-3-polyprenylbenzoate decarboxylase
VLPGVRAVHAVDAAGVHPLLLAVGSERYVPYADERRPMEVLTQANAILGQGQMSLAKYLFVVAGEDDPGLDVRDVRAFFAHALERFDPARDWHFQTNTTVDTLDYSGTGLNLGSKVVVAAAGPARRTLAREVPSSLRLLPGFGDARLALPGVLVVRAPAFGADGARSAEAFCEVLGPADALEGLPLVVLVDDAEFAARSLDNFVWVTFTRSDPARDVHGVGAFVEHKAWGCRGPVVIDARAKPHHAAPLVEDPAATRRVDALFARGGSLHGIER